MKRFSRERLEAIKSFLEERTFFTRITELDGIIQLVGETTGRVYIRGNDDVFKETNCSTDDKHVLMAIEVTEPKTGKEMNTTNQVIEATKKDATDIAKAVAKRIAAEKLLTAVGIPLGSMLKKAGLDPEIAKSPFAPAVVAMIGILAANSIQELPKKQLVHELCSLYLEQSAVNLLSPVLGDLVTMFTQAIEGIE